MAVSGITLLDDGNKTLWPLEFENRRRREDMKTIRAERHGITNEGAEEKELGIK